MLPWLRLRPRLCRPAYPDACVEEAAQRVGDGGLGLHEQQATVALQLLQHRGEAPKRLADNAVLGIRWVLGQIAQRAQKATADICVKADVYVCVCVYAGVLDMRMRGWRGETGRGSGEIGGRGWVGLEDAAGAASRRATSDLTAWPNTSPRWTIRVLASTTCCSRRSRLYTGWGGWRAKHQLIAAVCSSSTAAAGVATHLHLVLGCLQPLPVGRRVGEALAKVQQPLRRQQIAARCRRRRHGSGGFVLQRAVHEFRLPPRAYDQWPEHESVTLCLAESDKLPDTATHLDTNSNFNMEYRPR